MINNNWISVLIQAIVTITIKLLDRRKNKLPDGNPKLRKRENKKVEPGT